MPATDRVPDLSWLADSPVFIDGQQVGAFYDAVVGPAFRTVELQVTASWAEQSEKSTAGHLNAGLSALFPWLKVDAGMEARKAATRTRQDGQSITLQPVDSAARQLVQLSLHYLVNQAERICVVDQNTPFPGAGAIAVSPRMIAFVDVPAGTRFLPQAAELNDGRASPKATSRPNVRERTCSRSPCPVVTAVPSGRVIRTGGMAAAACGGWA